MFQKKGPEIAGENNRFGCLLATTIEAGGVIHGSWGDGALWDPAGQFSEVLTRVRASTKGQQQMEEELEWEMAAGAGVLKAAAVLAGQVDNREVVNYRYRSRVEEGTSQGLGSQKPANAQILGVLLRLPFCRFSAWCSYYESHMRHSQ